MAIQLRFAKLHLHEPQVVLNNILWTVETKVEMTGHNVQTLNKNETQLIPSVKHGSRGVMIWTCFASGHLAKY